MTDLDSKEIVEHLGHNPGFFGAWEGLIIFREFPIMPRQRVFPRSCLMTGRKRAIQSRPWMDQAQAVIVPVSIRVRGHGDLAATGTIPPS